MIQQKIIIANWKMNGSINLCQQYIKLLSQVEKNHVIICPPAIFIAKFKDSNLNIGLQYSHQQATGAFTGDISVSLAKEYAVSYCLVGHSERRSNHAESDAIIKQQAQLCLEHNITPIICIGESNEQYQSGITEDILKQQLINSCPQYNHNYIIAYEPVWAIGSGLTPTLDQISTTHNYIKSIIPAKVLYGGSVKDDNANSIANAAAVDGLLVGGASLDIKTFATIVKSV
jgi:triosephosphate isomerase